MNLSSFLKSKAFKILLPALLLVSAFAIFKAGFDYGQWLFAIIH